MKTLVLQKPFTLAWEERDMPDCLPGQALMRIEAASICGSDIHGYGGKMAFMTYPRVMGHELSGVIEQTDGSGKFKVGDKVAAMPYLYCGVCDSCKAGRTNCCVTMQCLGVHCDGGFCRYIALPQENLLKLPDDFDFKTAALIEPLAVSAHGVKRGKIKAGDKVLVLGGGPIGFGAALAAQAKGARVALGDISEDRRNFVRQCGFTAMNPQDADFAQQLKKHFGNLPEIVIDSTGNQQSMGASVNYVKHGGTLVFLGLQSGTLDVSDPEFHKKEVTIYASRTAQEEDFQWVLEKILAKELDPVVMITHTAPFSQAKEAFEDWLAQGPQVFKAVVLMNA